MKIEDDPLLKPVSEPPGLNRSGAPIPRRNQVIIDRHETMGECCGGFWWSVGSFFSDIFHFCWALATTVFCWADAMPVCGLLMEGHYITETLKEWIKDRNEVAALPILVSNTYVQTLNAVSEEILKDEIKMVLIPVYHRRHYMSLVIDKENRTITHYDPLRKKGLNPFEIKIIKALDLKIGEGDGEYKLICNHYYPQLDNWSCGFRELHFFRQVLEGKTMQEIENNPPTWQERQDMIHNYYNFVEENEELFRDARVYNGD